jgi:DNA-binding transcriptional ArsR family regulator
VADWRFLTNHALVFACLAEDPEIRLRDVADRVGITERAAHLILSELVEDGYVRREREGRRNRYEVRTDLPLRHPLQAGRRVGDLLGAPNGRSKHRGKGQQRKAAAARPRSTS